MVDAGHEQRRLRHPSYESSARPATPSRLCRTRETRPRAHPNALTRANRHQSTPTDTPPGPARQPQNPVSTGSSLSAQPAPRVPSEEPHPMTSGDGAGSRQLRTVPQSGRGLARCEHDGRGWTRGKGVGRRPNIEGTYVTYCRRHIDRYQRVSASLWRQHERRSDCEITSGKVNLAADHRRPNGVHAYDTGNEPGPRARPGAGRGRRGHQPSLLIDGARRTLWAGLAAGPVVSKRPAAWKRKRRRRPKSGPPPHEAEPSGATGPLRGAGARSRGSRPAELLALSRFGRGDDRRARDFRILTNPDSCHGLAGVAGSSYSGGSRCRSISLRALIFARPVHRTEFGTCVRFNAIQEMADTSRQSRIAVAEGAVTTAPRRERGADRRGWSFTSATTTPAGAVTPPPSRSSTRTRAYPASPRLGCPAGMLARSWCISRGGRCLFDTRTA